MFWLYSWEKATCPSSIPKWAPVGPIWNAAWVALSQNRSPICYINHCMRPLNAHYIMRFSYVAIKPNANEMYRQRK